MFGVVKRGQPYQADWRSRCAPNTANATDVAADVNAGAAANANQPAADAAAGQPAAATDTSSPAHPIAA
ncbi:MAG: hypothetical protein OXU71_10480, partial [Gammaproteobacteria bacterium]|nr:hypothetical protein [Gammaproteobacteria bacterium]